MPGVFSTELCGPFLLADDLLDQSLRFEQGALILPDAPGLGASVDESKLDEFRVA
jgi:muconate cycloisomerase